jgi:plastocyanin domain-containing protein
MELLVNVVTIALVLFTIFFFFGKKRGKAVEAKNEITVLVDGGYKPDVIKIKKGSPFTIKFDRRDESSCLEEVSIPDFGKNLHLKLGETTSVSINPNKPGEYGFHCGMNMFHGKIVVTE